MYIDRAIIGFVVGVIATIALLIVIGVSFGKKEK